MQRVILQTKKDLAYSCHPIIDAKPATYHHQHWLLSWRQHAEFIKDPVAKLNSNFVTTFIIDLV